MQLYSITYMYYSLIGSGITILLGIVVSYITGKCGHLCIKILQSISQRLKFSLTHLKISRTYLGM